MTGSIFRGLGQATVLLAVLQANHLTSTFKAQRATGPRTTAARPGGLVALTGVSPGSGLHEMMNPAIGGASRLGTRTTAAIDGSGMSRMHAGVGQP